MDVKQAASAYANIAAIGQQGAPASAPPAADETGPSFFDMVSQALGGSVNDAYKAEKISTLALMGKADITQLATSVSSAEMALQTVVAIRDKVISAYQQIMQMQM